MKNGTLEGILPDEAGDLYEWISAVATLGITASVLIFDDGGFRATTSEADPERGER